MDPPVCAKCGGTMKAVAFIEPPQGDVIEKILRDCGLSHGSSPRAPPTKAGCLHDPDSTSDGHPASPEEPRELIFVDIDTFEANFRLTRRPAL